MRDTIFISHATPEDNDFTIWLASRLQLLGYKVWIDKTSLLGGEKFWQEIDQTIRNQAAKVLLVYSKHICQLDENQNVIPGKLKDGVSKEYSLAESIGKQNNLGDFIILLNIDKSTYNLFIGADRLNQIPFYDDWGIGLNQLETKLIKDQILKNQEFINSDFSSWYTNQYIVPNPIIKRKELYYSNWWPINALPEYLYVFEFKTEKLAKTVYLERTNIYPFGKISNFISSFEPSPEFVTTKEGKRIPIKHQNVHRIKVTDILLGFDSAVFPTQRDAENHLKNFLQRIFHLLMRGRGLYWYDMANKRMAYFHTPKSLEPPKVKFEYPYRTEGKSKTKTLIGKHGVSKWHFAVSAKPIFSPLLAFNLTGHLTFTDDGFNVWKKDKEVDTAKIHSQRRSKGKRFFNEEWRDMLIAFIHSLKMDNKIELSLSSTFTLKMPEVTEYFWADFGYIDPSDKGRQEMFSIYESQDDTEEQPNEDVDTDGDDDED